MGDGGTVEWWNGGMRGGQSTRRYEASVAATGIECRK